MLGRREVSLRALDDGPFTDDECRHVEALVPIIAKSLRAGIVALDMEAKGAAAMLVVDRDNRVQDLTIEAVGCSTSSGPPGLTRTGCPQSSATWSPGPVESVLVAYRHPTTRHLRKLAPGDSHPYGRRAGLGGGDDRAGPSC